MKRDERLLPLPNVGDLPSALDEREYTSSYDDFGSERKPLREYIHVVYKRLPLILAVTILATVVSAFYMYRLPSVYSASASLIIEPRKPKLTQTVNINFGNDFKYYNTQLRLLKHRDLMYDIVLKNGLYKDSNLFMTQKKGILQTIKSILFSREEESEEADLLTVVNSDNKKTEEISLTPEEKRRAEIYSSILSGTVTTSQVKNTNIVNVSVTEYDPMLTALLANEIAESFISRSVEQETRRVKDLNRELKVSIKDLKATLVKQEQQLVATMKRSDLALTGERGMDFTASKLSTLSNQWLVAMDDRRRAEANYDAARNSENLSVLPIEIIGRRMRDEQEKYLAEKSKLEGVLRSYDSQISEAKVKLKELMVKYTDEYAEVKKIKEKIKSLEELRTNTEKDYNKRLNSEKTKGEREAKKQILSGLEAKLKAAKNRETQLFKEYLREKTAANVKGQAERELTTLKREIETNRSLLGTYIQRQKEQELTITSSLPDNIKILSKAVIPLAPIGPDRNRNILVAFLVSLFGGVGLAFLLDYLDDSVRTSDDVSRNLNLPTLALIPYQDAVKKRLGNGSDNDENNIHSLALIALQDTRSNVAESYRHLRTSLLFSSAGKPPKAILVTSCQPSEGKTTTAANTAITLAQSAADVVLIDCDLRRPRLHQHFKMNNLHGLTNYLSGEKDTKNLLKQCPDIPNLKVITSGPIPPNPAELLGSDEMKNLIQVLKGNYKHVVLDSSPAISFADSAIISTLVDGVVLVAKAGTSSSHLMKRFKQRLAGLGTRIYGVVINSVKPDSVEYNYYGYNYHYDYYSNKDETTPLLEDERNNRLIEKSTKSDSDRKMKS